MLDGQAAIAQVRGRLHTLLGLVDAYLSRDERASTSPEVARLVRSLRADYAEHSEGPDALDALADRCGLDAHDCHLLVVATAPDLDARFGALFGLLDRVESRVRPSSGLGIDLLGVGPFLYEARRLSPTAPLRRHGLVEVRGQELMQLRTLAVPERVIDHLLARVAPDAVLPELTVSVPGRHDDVAVSLARAFQAGLRLGLVRSPIGTTGLSSAQGAMDLLEIPALIVDAGRRGATVPLVEAARTALLEATLQGAGLVFTGLRHADADGREILGLVQSAPVPVVVVDDPLWPSSWVTEPHLRATATELSRDERAAMWSVCVDADALVDDRRQEWEDLLALRVTPQDIFEAVREASVMSTLHDVSIEVTHLRAALRDQSATRLGTSAECATPLVTLDDLVLPTSTRGQVADLVSWARARSLLLEGWRLQGKGNKGTGMTALFSGGPGTGKTLAAEAIAGELGLDLMTVDLSAVVDKYIGETEKRLELLISEAETSNVVLFFDEADSIFGARSAVSDSRDRYANQGVSYLLQRIEKFDGLAILATNMKGNLDKAFMRRIHHVIAFPDPDVDTRSMLWRSHLGEIEAWDESDPLDLALLSTSVDLAGGNIRSIVQSAAFLAVADQHRSGAEVAVGMRHVVRAVDREYDKLGRRAPALPGRTGP